MFSLCTADSSRSYTRCEQRHARRLVDAAALRVDDAVLDLVAHAEAVAPADGVRVDERARRATRSVLPLIATGTPRSKLDRRRSSGSTSTSRLPVRDAHDGLDDLHRHVEALEVLRLVRRAEHVRVGRVRLLGRHRVRQADRLEVLAHLLAAAERVDERAVEPRLVDRERRVDEHAVAEEALDVVALVGAAVAEDVHAVFAHRADDRGRGDGAAERRRVEVLRPPVDRWNAPHWMAIDRPRAPAPRGSRRAARPARRASIAMGGMFATFFSSGCARSAVYAKTSRPWRDIQATAHARVEAARRRRCRCGCPWAGASGGCGSWAGQITARRGSAAVASEPGSRRRTASYGGTRRGHRHRAHRRDAAGGMLPELLAWSSSLRARSRASCARTSSAAPRT